MKVNSYTANERKVDCPIVYSLFVFSHFVLRLVELNELDEFNENQSSMTDVHCKLFYVSHSQLTLTV